MTGSQPGGFSLDEEETQVLTKRPVNPQNQSYANRNQTYPNQGGQQRFNNTGFQGNQQNFSNPYQQNQNFQRTAGNVKNIPDLSKYLLFAVAGCALLQLIGWFLPCITDGETSLSIYTLGTETGQAGLIFLYIGLDLATIAAALVCALTDQKAYKFSTIPAFFMIYMGLKEFFVTLNSLQNTGVSMTFGLYLILIVSVAALGCAIAVCAVSNKNRTANNFR